MIYFRKILNLFSFILARIILLFVQIGKRKNRTNTILITRLDSIGDYILFRNFLKILKNSKKYKDYSITLCGNIIWKDIAKTFDSGIANDFIWIDRKKFYSNMFYKYKILKNIYKRGFEVAIDSAYNREILYSDIIIKASAANKKIGSSGSLDKHAVWKRKLFSNSFYDLLIEQADENLFEFNRNKEFFEKVLEEKISITKPELNLSDVETGLKLPQKYIVVFPGSKDAKKRWDVQSYAKICEYIISKFSLPIVIPVSGGEKYIALKIINKVQSDKLIDLSGKTNLIQLAKIISDSELLISNDTAAIHISAAVDKQFLCISDGSFIGRFLPYPQEIFSEGNYLFPAEVINDIQRSDKLSSGYRYNSSIDINSITVDTVKEKIKELLN